MYRIYQRLGLHILVVLMTILQADHVTWGCPADVCICKWKNGKQTVECGGQQLPNIPEGMDASTQVLNFSGNALQVLQSERFLRMDLLNLQKIYLSRNQLIRIHEKAFRGLSNLVELDLSDNALQHVPTETFQDYGSLMRLSLTGNPIRELKSTAFRHLSFLTTLELSNCQIERVENEAFVGLDNLEWLRLDGNRIGFIQGTHILPKALHGISLHSNRWMCDCRLLDIHAWLINYNTPQSDEPKCVEPARLKGQTIKSLKKDELACLPEVSPTSSYTEISQGRNISIMCVVRAIPEPKILWLFNGQVMTNDSFVDNLHMYYYIEESASGSAEEKRSEIFIYNVGAEDNGTFSCVGTNVAGTTFSNYTLRVIIEEPPVVNEVSFPRDYMKYIIVSSTGGGVMVFIIVGTILLKCKQRKPDQKRGKKYAIGSGSVTTALTNLNSNGSSGNDDNSNIKCSSIINGDGDSLNGSGGLIIGEGRTPTKACKENGVILGGQMKQNLMLYAPLDHMQQNQQHQHLQHQQQQQQQEQHQQQKQQHQQQNMDGVTLGGPGSLQISITNTPPPALIMSSNGLAYCSPPGSVRNYQEKNPDLVNDAAESVKHKTIIKSAVSSLDTDCDAASDCSGPCSIQSMSVAQAPVQYDNCYQLAAAAQFGSQLMRPAGMPNMNMNSNSRFAAISTLPRGMQLKTLMSGLNMTPTGNPQSAAPQHQVDVHLNPVCFLSQDGFAYDFSNAAAHHHAYLQQQHALNSLHHSNSTVQQKPQAQQQHQHQQQQQQQQNFYRTLPHNRVNKQQQFAAASTTNPNMRYSLEAEFLQNRSNTSNYEKYLPNVRFTAEGYPQAQHQYPSPPEGYKTSGPVTSCGSLDTMEGVGTTTLTTPTFQQWPPCLPGFQIQPIRYPPTIVGVLSPQQQQLHKPMAQTPPSQSQQPTSETITQKPIPTQNHTQATTSVTATSGTGKDSISIASNASATGTTMEMKKRCMTAQADNSTIPECDESEVSPSTSMVVGNSIQDNMGNGSTASGATKADAGKSEQSTPKLRHLNGPLADSPDEGYVGEAPESSDI